MNGRQGVQVRTLCGPLLDFEKGEEVRQILADENLACSERVEEAEGCRFSLLNFDDGPIRSSIFLPHGPPQNRPQPQQGRVFLDSFRQAIDQWRPAVVLTYGGYRLAGPMLRRARERGIAIVFWLRNFAYREAELFVGVDSMIVPSEYSAAHYRRTLGIEPAVIPSPLNWSRIACDRPADARYVTFVNPQPHKGVFVFARIAEQLFRVRPDIPLLVVEGRSGVEWLQKMRLDLSDLTNLNVMKNTPDPRDFYRVSHAVLMPSLCRESFGRVAAEAMINGIPVLASRRGALPEVLGEAGFLFDVPRRYTPETRLVPTPEEVTPWVDTIIRLWDDRSFYDEVSRRCRERAALWRPEVLLPEYERVFEKLTALHSPDRRPLF